jgi:hypothetical protein
MRFMAVARMATDMTLNHRSRTQTIAIRGKTPGSHYASITEIHISTEVFMDEYLFMTLAKLKADRLKLAREQRATASDPEQLRLDWVEPAEQRRHSTRWFSQQPLWREQS